MKNSFQRYFRFISGVVVVMLLIILFSSYHVFAATLPAPFFQYHGAKSQVEVDALVAGFRENSAPYVGPFDTIAIDLQIEALRPFMADFVHFQSWVAGCSSPVYGVLYKVYRYTDGKLYSGYQISLGSNFSVPSHSMSSDRYYFGGYMAKAGRRYTQAFINTGVADIIARTEPNYVDWVPYADMTSVISVFKLSDSGADSLFPGSYPYGEDPSPLTGDTLYPQGYRGWDYLRNFGADALPQYEDLLYMVHFLTDLETNPPDVVANFFYLVLRSKTSGRYEVHILGRNISESQAQQAGIKLKWKKSYLWGLIGGYYQAQNNPSIEPQLVGGTPGYSAWIGPGRSWFPETSRLGDTYPYKVNNSWHVIEFGAFVPEHQETLPPVFNPPQETPPPYVPGDLPEPPQALSAIEEALKRMFVPSSLKELDAMEILGDVASPVTDFLGIFTDIAAFSAESSPPVIMYNGQNVLAPLADVMDMQVTLFGYTGTLISIVRKLNTVKLSLVMAFSFYILGRNLFRG